MTDKPDLKLEYLKKLSAWKGMYEKKNSMEFLKWEFKNNIERPFRQLSLFAQLWEDFVPEELNKHSKLASFVRGLLTIHVDSPSHKYLLDQLLRNGLQDELIKHARSNKPPLRKVKVIITRVDV